MKSDEKKRIGIFSLHPGAVRTELFRSVGLLKIPMYVLYPIWWLITKNCWQGAQTTLQEEYHKVFN